VLLLVCFLQLITFGLARSSHVDFLETSSITFKHLFLNNWDPAYETMPYPPAMGAFAVYNISDFYTMINFALTQVFISAHPGFFYSLMPYI